MLCLSGGAVRSQHVPVPVGVDMNDPSTIARFRGQPYMPGPRQFDMYPRLVGPRLEAQQMYSVCPDSQQSTYQVCFCLLTGYWGNFAKSRKIEIVRKASNIGQSYGSYDGRTGK